MGKRVVVTGASGFIGRHAIAPLRARGFTPVFLVRPGGAGSVRRMFGADAIMAEVDLLDVKAVGAVLEHANADTMAHFAWHDAPGTRWTAIENCDWAVSGLAMARSFAAYGGRRLVVCGTCAEYDWSHQRLSEASTPIIPATLYGASKAALHLMLDRAQTALGLSVAWGRVFYCYGPGEARGRLLRDVIDGLSEGRSVDCTDGLQVRDYIHVADVGEAFARLVASDIVGPVNIASGTGVAVRDLVREAARQLGATQLLRFGALQRPANDPPSLVADVTRLKQELGFELRFDLPAGIADAIRSISQGEDF